MMGAIISEWVGGIVRIRTTPTLAPSQEIDRGASIGPPYVGIADVGGEEFQKADLCPLAGRYDEVR
jgi:hypothetical protein